MITRLEIQTKGGWLTTPWFDAFFLTAFPVVFLFFGDPYRTASLVSTSILTMFLANMHLTGTLALVYLDRNELRKKPFLYVWPPLILIGILTTLRLEGLRNQASTLFFYGFIGHEIFQYYFITRVFFLSRERYPTIDALISCTALVAGPVYCFLQSLNSFNYQYYGNVLSFHLNQNFLEGLRWCALFAMAVFVTRQIYIYARYRKIAWFPLLMVLVSNCVFYVPIIILKSQSLFFYASFRTHHALQYLAWIFIYCRLKYKGQIVKGAQFLSYLSLPRKGVYFFAFLIFLASIALGASKIAKQNHHIVISELLFLNLAAVHFYLDVMLWWNQKRIIRTVM